MHVGIDTDARALSRQAEISLARLYPRLETSFAGAMGHEDWDAYSSRLRAHFASLFAPLVRLYGGQYDFFYHLESIVTMTARLWSERPAPLKALDREREECPTWFQSERMMGGVCYVDLFAGSLQNVRARIPYLKELGLTYLHLMPLFRTPSGNSDGGYAVSDYRDVDPGLGTMEDLAELATDLRQNHISLVLDFVLNHTSDEHEWAKRARAGDPDYEQFYFIFQDRSFPDLYSRTLREIFPDLRPGSFTYLPDRDAWVWTTFNSFQWDLNYANPEVFTRMAEEMLSLANRGAEVLRFDALAFIWKEMGTSCENLPQAHLLIEAFNAVARVAAPALLFKSEAIVHPDEVIKYVGADECRLSYNPLLMALLWEALATREVRLLHHSMRERFKLPPDCAWVNYIRSHDDIGWTFDDGDAARLGINAYDHRRFLNAFYTGRFADSFARGLPFQENPNTGDARISGTSSSLVGLERAVQEGDEAEISLAIARLLLLYGIVLSIGGIPLLYLGDEVGTLNDYGFRKDPAKAQDSRWLHRPAADRDRIARRNDTTTIEGRIFGGLRHLIGARRQCPALAGNEMEVVDTGNPHVFAYVRRHGEARLLVLANVGEAEQSVSWNLIRIYGLSYSFRDVLSGSELAPEQDLTLPSYGLVWLVAL